MRKIILSVMMLLSVSTAFADLTCPPGLSSDICQFETKVYTGTDFKNTNDLRSVLTQFKNLLMAHTNDSSMIQEQILSIGNQIVEESYNQRAPKELLAAANGDKTLLKVLGKLREWEAKNGEIVPLDWHLPSEFLTLVFTLNRSYDVSTDRVRFGIGVYGVEEKFQDIEQFKVVKYGGETILDKSAGIGSWDDGIKSSEGKSAFSASNMIHSSSTPMPDGLYLLTLKVKGQDVVNGWFFLHGTCATSPVVLSPQVNEKVHNPTPTFRFQEFRSSSTLTSDHHKRSINIWHEGDNKQVWRTSMINPKVLNEVSMSQDPNGVGDKALAPGSYRLSLGYEERSYFGQLLIGRSSNTTVTFGVAK